VEANHLKPIWAYVRVSTDAQESDGHGLDVQRQHIATYAAANNIHVERWISDTCSGAKEERPGLRQIRDAVAAGEVGTLLVYRIDRLSRDSLIAEKLHREFSAKTRVFSVSEAFDDSMSGRLMRQIMQAFAEYERSLITERMKSGRRESVKTNGGYSGGPGVYGYESIGEGKLEIVPFEACVINMIFSMREAGQSFAAIADALNRGGDFTRHGGQWGPTQVRRIVERREFYAGRATITKSIDADKIKHEPILVGK
jgi:DNA invertase Pin-like site-specific DNA recombinase